MEGCEKVYSRHDNLKNHFFKEHKIENAAKQGRFVCSICNSVHYHATTLAQHLEKEHKQKIGNNISEKLY